MAFIALDKSSNKRIDITEYEDPRQELQASNIVCQLCGSPMIIKAGLIMRPHFAHRAKCPSNFGSHPESWRHRIGKKFLAENLPRIYGGIFNVEPQMEYPIKDVRRVADVMLCFPNGWRVAHEVQLASITTEELDARTQDYLLAGIDLFWWFGGRADTQANRAWAEKRFGVVGLIQFPGENNEEVKILAKGGVKLALMPGKHEDVLVAQCYTRGFQNPWVFWGVANINDTRNIFGENGINWSARRFMRLAFFRAHEISVNLSWWAFRWDLGIIPCEYSNELYKRNLLSFESFLKCYRINKRWYWHFNDVNARQMRSLAKLSLKRQLLPYSAICKIKEQATWPP